MLSTVPNKVVFTHRVLTEQTCLTCYSQVRVFVVVLFMWPINVHVAYYSQEMVYHLF
jgi:hypothetical protein